MSASPWFSFHPPKSCTLNSGQNFALGNFRPSRNLHSALAACKRLPVVSPADLSFRSLTVEAVEAMLRPTSAVPTRLAKRASERFREIAVIKSRTNRFIWPAAVEGTKSRFVRFKTKDDLLKQVGPALGGHGREAGGDRFPPRHGHSSLRPERLICEQARDQLRVQGVAGLVRLDARQ